MTALRRIESNPRKLPAGTLVDLFFGTIEKLNLERAQLRRGADGWEGISHQQLLDNVHACADGLSALGMQRGDRVALISENRVEWALADYAMLCSGILNVPLYPTLPVNQLSFIMKDAGVRAIFVSNGELLEKIRACRASVPSLEYIITFDDLQSAGPNELTLAQMLERGRAPGTRTDRATFETRARQARPDDVATLIYTSGTTGQPKGVMLTHNNLYTNVIAQDWLKPTPGEPFITVSFLPLSHVFQRMVDYCVFWGGATIAYSSIENAVQAIAEVRPTITVAVPRVYEKIYAAVLSATGVKRNLVLWARQVALDWADDVLNGRTPSLHLKLKHAVSDKLVFSKVRARLGGRIVFFVSGGAPLDPQIAKFFYGARILILEGYGLTETSPVIAVNTTEHMRLGTVGKLAANTEVAIADDGEILVRGPQIMKGYYNNPEATREVIDPDGWFHTGDIGDIDDDGFLSITGRKKELIVTAGGKNIAPQPIQNAAKQSRYVSDAVVIGDKRPYPIILLVPNFDTLTAWAQVEQIPFGNREELAAHPRVRAKLEAEITRRFADFARYELPKKILVLPREFDLVAGEVTPKLSVRRHVVEKNLSEAIEALYSEAQPEAESAG